MTSKERTFKPEYAKTLFKIAATDLEAARLLAATGKARPETTIFHVQQAIEKTLKAVICYQRKPIPLVHDIGSLLGKIDEKDFPPQGYDLTEFNDYAGIRRYEEGQMELTNIDISAAISIGEEVLNWARQIIKP